MMKSIAILGGGESGIGSALLAQKRGLEVFVSDHGSIAEKYKQELKNNNISFEEKGHDFERIESQDVVVKSPGIPDSSTIIKHLISKGNVIISEIEFAFRYSDSKVVAITGSNGKTTTTSLIYHLLKVNGLNVGLGGNIGYSYARLLSEDKTYDWVVLELSSFQLENINTFSADIGIILNITPDHLDRYDYDMTKYAAAKWNLAMGTKNNGLLVINKDDEWINKSLKESILKCQVNGISYENPKPLFSSKDGKKIEVRNSLRLLGHHNYFNALVAAKVADSIGVKPEGIALGLSSFKAIEHRLEPVLTNDGIAYINDSKATNVDSVKVALASMDNPVIWIAGGVDKGNDYSQIMDLVIEKVKAIVCLTKDDSALREAFTGIVHSISTTQDINECINIAKLQADEGDIILLSPACASFDLFDNYKHRGEAFKESIKTQ